MFVSCKYDRYIHIYAQIVCSKTVCVSVKDRLRGYSHQADDNTKDQLRLPWGQQLILQLG